MKKLFILLLVFVLALSANAFATDEAVPEGYTVSVDAITAVGEEAMQYMIKHDGFRLMSDKSDEAPEGYTVSDNAITAVGEEAIQYMIKHDGFRLFETRATTPPTATYPIGDHSVFSGSYSMTSHVYSNYCFYPHDIDKNFNLELEPETTHTLKVEFIPKGSTSAAWSKTYNLTKGNNLGIVVPESYLDPSTAYYIKFTNSGNGGARVKGNYYLT